MRRHPGQLLAASQESLLQLGVAAAVSDVPLPGRDDLQRPVALLVEVGLARGRGRLADQVAGLAEHRHDGLPGGEDRLAGDRLPGVRVGNPFRLIAEDPAVPPDDHPSRKLQLAPPDHVGQIAERAAHGDAGALVRLGRRVGEHRKFHAVDRRSHRRAEQRLVALVVRVGDQRDAGGDQLGSSGLDVDRIGSVGGVEGDAVVVAGVVPGLQLSLGHRGLEGHVPHRRRLGPIRLAAGQVAQEPELRHLQRLVADGGVEQAPVHTQPDAAPEVLERDLVDLGQLVAELDEVGPADRHLSFRIRVVRRSEVGFVRQRGIAPHAVVVLHPAFGGQAVVVPADRVEDVLAAHPLVARDEVGVGVGEHVPHVQRARHRGRRGVDAVDLVPGRRAAEGVRALAPPALDPGVFQSLERRLVRYDAPVGAGVGTGVVSGRSHAGESREPLEN